MSTLYILSGCPASGKSSWAESHFDNIVSRDAIRFYYLEDGDEYFAHEREVQEEFYGTLADYLDNGDDVVADATHVTLASMKKTIGEVKHFASDENFRVVVIRFDTPLEVCLKRNAKRTGREFVPEKTIMEMKGKFDNVYVDGIQRIPKVKYVITISDWRV